MTNDKLPVNPAEFLRDLQEKSVKNNAFIKKLYSKIEKVITAFKERGETVLFFDNSLKVKVNYLNNDALYLISGIKIIATTWDNNCASQFFKCGVNIKVKFIFVDGVSLLDPNRKWSCDHSSLKLTEKYENNEKTGFVINSEDEDKTLKVKDINDFNELIITIKNAFTGLGLAYKD